jgi:ADP-ribosyl-[dinitrogen reductase] hydrolase
VEEQLTMDLTAAMVDRAVGVVLGSAAGDAMGAPYEFGAADPEAPCQLEGGGAFDWEPGEWTDDTQMALAVLSVLAEGSTDTEAMGRAMVRWYESGPVDVGNQTSAVLGAAASLGIGASAAALAYQAQNPESAGNGALMRTGPVALAHLGDRDAVAALAASVASLTHPHVASIEACVLWSLAIEQAVMTSSEDEVFDWRSTMMAGLDHIDTARRALWRSRIEEAHGRDPASCANNGWVIGAFKAAYATITSMPVPEHSDGGGHLADALRLASRSGGDTDTVAAIAGSLLGARWGASAVPPSWRQVLHGRRTYDEPALRAEDLETLARRAIAGSSEVQHAS